MSRYPYGGQALLEGVLMRGRDAIAVAIRHPDGGIVYQTEPLNSVLHRSRFARAPFFRGLVVLYETLVIGTRWLMRSGQVAAAGEGLEIGRRTIALTLLLTLALAVGLFVILPLLLARFVAPAEAASLHGAAGAIGIEIGTQDPFVQHLIEGVIRVAIFIGYLLVVSGSGEIRRVFQYHGAEHKTIHALEHEDPLVPELIQRYPTAHPRCGTEFLVVFVVVSILVFSLLAGQNLIVSVVGRIALVPVIASVSYEILRFGARHRSNAIVKWIFMPGIWLQLITTKQPDDGMVEVAIASMREAIAANGEEAPPGSLDPYRRPIDEVLQREPADAATATPSTPPQTPPAGADTPAAPAAGGQES
jgi:uncharacterized protein YqhQ